MTLNDLKADFEFMDSWEDRFRYVMELGKDLPPFPEFERTEANKVRGCASQVWLVRDEAAGLAPDGSQVLSYHGDSDAILVRGIVAILLRLVNGKSAKEVAGLDLEGQFASLGLREHLTPQRSNGLASMVARIKAEAEALAG